MVVYRNIKRKSDGKWIDVLFTKAGDRFTIKASQHIRDIAAGLSVAENTLEVVDSDKDDRTGDLIKFPEVRP